MKEHPIIFSTEMVQAILEGRKTMTRRIIKPQPQCIDYTWEDPVGYDIKGRCAIQDDELQCLISCKYGRDGDQLWVREKWENDLGRVNFYAGNIKVETNVAYRRLTKWKPSIHLKRKDARINLLIKSIRVERLKDISQDDARKEGVFCSESPIGPCYLDYLSGQCNAMTTAKLSFQSLWKKINGTGSWDANPWVWVIEFERVEP
jgi:hypothetical protein